MRDDNCIFCKIINGDIPSYTVYEDDDFKCILDVGPAAKGHTLILPKNHYANVMELPEETTAKAFTLAKKLAAHIQTSLNADGVNILQNNNEAAGQTVFHFHIHVIPRYDTPENKSIITWKQNSFPAEEMQEVLEKLV